MHVIVHVQCIMCNDEDILCTFKITCTCNLYTYMYICSTKHLHYYLPVHTVHVLCIHVHVLCVYVHVLCIYVHMYCVYIHVHVCTVVLLVREGRDCIYCELLHQPLVKPV